MSGEEGPKLSLGLPTAQIGRKTGRNLPTAKIVTRTPTVKVPGALSEARRKRVHDRLKGSFSVSDDLG